MYRVLSPFSFLVYRLFVCTVFFLFLIPKMSFRVSSFRGSFQDFTYRGKNKEMMSPAQKCMFMAPRTETVLTSNLTPSEPRELHLYGGLPMTAMPKEGNRQWGIPPITDSTAQLAETLLIEGCPSASQKLSLFRAFDRWRTTKFTIRPSPGRVLILFAAYLLEAELKATTVGGYVRTARAFCQNEDNIGRCEWGLVTHVLKGLDRRAAEEEPDHAPDISEERAQEILDTVTDVEIQFIIWLMLNTGARVKDLLRLKHHQLFIHGNRVYVEFKVTKVATTPKERYNIELPIWIPFKTEWNMFLSRELPVSASCNRINKLLHSIGFQETTYSFRRLFINRVIDRFTENDIVDWMKVIQLTGHEQSRSVQASYQESAPKRARKKASTQR